MFSQAIAQGNPPDRLVKECLVFVVDRNREKFEI